MDTMDFGDEWDDEPMTREILEDIWDGIQSHPDVNRRKECYKIRDRIKQRHSECKGSKSFANLYPCFA